MIRPNLAVRIIIFTGIVLHKEDIDRTLIARYSLGNVLHFELDSAQSVILALLVEKNILRLAKATSVNRLLRDPNC